MTSGLKLKKMVAGYQQSNLKQSLKGIPLMIIVLEA